MSLSKVKCDIESQQQNNYITLTFTKINEQVAGLKCSSYRNG